MYAPLVPISEAAVWLCGLCAVFVVVILFEIIAACFAARDE